MKSAAPNLIDALMAARQQALTYTPAPHTLATIDGLVQRVEAVTAPTRLTVQGSAEGLL